MRRISILYTAILSLYLSSFIPQSLADFTEEPLTDSLESRLATTTCKLPRGKVLRIGCTYKCPWILKFRMGVHAQRLGYKVDFVSLRGYDTPEEALESVDAVIFPGGADINPTYYTTGLPEDLRNWIIAHSNLYQASREGDYRDAFEFELAQTYLRGSQFDDLPVLGICRGMQMLSVASGIPLYLDLHTELGVRTPRKRFQSFKTLENDSLMGSLLPHGSTWVWQMHHQGLRYDYFKAHPELYPHLRVTASSDQDRVAEALEFDGKTALAVQFHPESSRPLVTTKIFRWLLQRACEKTKKEGTP